MCCFFILFLNEVKGQRLQFSLPSFLKYETEPGCNMKENREPYLEQDIYRYS